MAFEKRTWLARIGTGLNKFIIGNKDGGGKQTLTNSPDSVTQIGDVISAENLNDLEDRIETAINANSVRIDNIEAEVEGIRLTKVWENPNPSASTFEPQAVTVNDEVVEFLIYYRIASVNVNNGAGFFHGKCWTTSKTMIFGISRSSCQVFPQASIVRASTTTRSFDVDIANNSTTFTFSDAHHFEINDTPTVNAGTNNSYLVPLVVYKVGNIYNS